MTRPIAISLSPNTEPDDIERAREVLSHPETWENQQLIYDVEHKIAQVFGNQIHAYATSSGRQALYDLLKIFGIGAGDEVIVQAFTCIAVPAPILWVGATPVYADIKPDTYNFDPADVARKITPRTKAIIIQHTFGIPGPIAEIQTLAQPRGIRVIEDCAHSLGVYIHGQPLGTFGDAAILSFGRDKVLSSVFGGAVITKNNLLTQRLRTLDELLPLPPHHWVRQQLRHPIIMSDVLPQYFRFGLGKLKLVAQQHFGRLSKAVAPEEKKGDQPDHIDYRFSPALASLLLLQLDKLGNYVRRRETITQHYAQAFGGPTGPLLRFPLQRENARQIILAARKQRILLGDWYSTPLAPADSDYTAFQYTPGSCPVAEAVARKIINLPTYPLMTDEQVQEVIEFIRHSDFVIRH